MEHQKTTYESLMAMESLSDLTTAMALDHIGVLIDLSLDLQKIEGLQRAMRLSEEFQKRQLTSAQLATLHYFLANAWAAVRRISRTNEDQVWDWEQQEFEKEITYLRLARQQDGFSELPKERRCEILTNLANAFNHIGRFVEAIEYWNKAIAEVPSFAMAVGNRGIGLTHYARALYDVGHRGVFLKHAYTDLKTAPLSPLHEDAREGFDKHRKWIESVLTSENIDKDHDMNSFSLGKSEQEIGYRRWCLDNRLFLNPLNDLGPYPIAGRDIMTTPDVVDAIDVGPRYPGYFNQMKQEFVSARYLYYAGINAEQPHFSDREVLLYNTLDYPSYSLAVEKIKAAFRMSYSLFDKIAYFLNHYLGLSIHERDVNFKTFWYTLLSKTKGLRTEFRQCKNMPLRGLFWLSKDLFEDKSGFKEAIEPDARELYVIRNHLEHKYLKLHDDYWLGPGFTPVVGLRSFL